MPTHRRCKMPGRLKTGAGAATMALAMSWLGFVGLRGPADTGSTTPGVTLDDRDTESRDEQPDRPVSGNGDVPDGWTQVLIEDAADQMPSAAPSAPGADSNTPSTMDGGGKPVQAPLSPLPATAPVAGEQDLAPKPAEKPAQPAKKPAAQSPAPEASAPAVKEAGEEQSEPAVIVVQEEPDVETSTTMKHEEPSPMDHLGHLIGFLRPFSLAVPAPLPPGPALPVPKLPESVDQAPQPKRHEQLQPTELPPEPIQVKPLPKAFGV